MNLFVGEFPPPYNGVSVKNMLLYQQVYSLSDIKIIDLLECKRMPYRIPIVGMRLVWGLLVADYVIVGVGADVRRKIIMRIRRILRGKQGMQGVIMLAMGGRMHLVITEDIDFKRQLSEIGHIIVEADGIARGLEKEGLKKVKVIPNCRSVEGATPPREIGKTVKFVYFSIVCAEKGMDDIREAISQLDCSYTLDIYGEIANRYRKEFESFLEEFPEVHYQGVYDSINGNVYRELNQYDVMLFLSHWHGEGVPGTLVESKMAGITAIVSDWNFNSEVVVDGIEGIVLKGRLSDAMRDLAMNKERLAKLKMGAYESRKRYDFDIYKDELLELIEK